MNSVPDSPTDDQIDRIRQEPGDFREYHDSVRCVHAFLQAQTQTQSPHTHIDRHIISAWAGLYVAQPWIPVAAKLAGLKVDRVTGGINISAKLILPDLRRLDGIAKARTQMNYTDVRSGHAHLIYRTAEAFTLAKQGHVRRTQIEHYHATAAT